MRIPVCLCVCLIAVGVASAQVSPVSHTAEKIRSPELTISNAAAKATRVIAYNPNGKFLAVAGHDNLIRLYDIRIGDRLTAEVLQALTGHTAGILAIGFSDTNTLVSVSEDQTAKTWEVVSGKLLRSVELNLGKPSIAVIAPGAQPFLAEGTQKQVRLWNYQTGEKLKTFEANDSDVSALAFTPDGRLLVIGTFKGVVRVLDVGMWKVKRMIDLDAPVYSLAASGSRVAVGYGDGTVAMLNLEGEQSSVPERKSQTGRINALAFSAKGDRLASASADKTVTVWDVKKFESLGSWLGRSGEVFSVAFSPDGHRVVSGGADGRINCWMMP